MVQRLYHYWTQQRLSDWLLLSHLTLGTQSALWTPISDLLESDLGPLEHGVNGDLRVVDVLALDFFFFFFFLFKALYPTPPTDPKTP